MKKFFECAKSYFLFLENMGCEVSSTNNSIIYTMDNLKIEILFDKNSYELACYFSDAAGRVCSLQDVLEYNEIGVRKGTYQVKNMENLEEGVIYLAEVIADIMKQAQIPEIVNLEKLLQRKQNLQKEKLKNYYVKRDLSEADKFWKVRDYDKAKKLYERHSKSLSKVQRKRLEYIGENKITPTS